MCCDPHSQRLQHSQWSRNRCFSGILLLFLWSNGYWQFDLWFFCLFLNPACKSVSSQFTYCWSLAWRILSVTLLAYEMSAVVQRFECSLGLCFSGIGMKTDLFQSCDQCWVFQIWWHIKCSNLTASSFRIWNSSAGVLSPSLSLFLVMILKVHLTSHYRMSRWVTTPLWFSRSLRPFLV